jgi:hypothetical protein
MSVILFAAAFALGGAAATLVFYLKTRGPRKETVLTEGTFNAPLPDVPLPPNAHKFRVVFYTQRGAKARDLYAQLSPSPQEHHSEIVELWHFGDRRSWKP